ncbi:band 7 protein AGAP004871-like isoform X2 [Branchiostoma floridae]|uniref:Band 7 protein AGAP004871-like isoform X2 n=1 Tax=Branchiostoma floridae TaxID=7739 RepID=A0A9J7MWC2_BRAFL|nr:band 7 protein AGAP004871-like isoform X2 [Branchiostoma floridae]
MQLGPQVGLRQGADSLSLMPTGEEETVANMMSACQQPAILEQCEVKMHSPYCEVHVKKAGEPAPMGLCGYILMFFSYILVVLTFPISLCFFIKVVQEYERAVIFRLGQLVPGGAKGPGIFFSLPCTDSYRKVDLRTVSFDVPPQEILSKDSVTVAVDAVVYYRVQNATISVTNVENAQRSTRLLAATTLRNVLGTKTLGEILTERENISHQMQTALDEATDAWGVKVERVEVKDVRLPVQLQRAMAAEAEATREARAKVIAAEGEKNASRALKEASEVISESPAALQLRYLQTLNAISAEKNSTIIFPLPVDLLRGILPFGSNGNHHMNAGQNPGSHADTPPGV